MSTRNIERLLPALLLFLLAVPAQARDWKATERTEHYMVDGSTGMALYQSIGVNGPLIEARGRRTRTIAHTTWDLKWHRDYVRRGKACRLTGVKPFLVITTTLPKARAKLAAPVAAQWKAFAEGIAAHERVHGDLIRAMVDDMIVQTSELTVDNDPGCKAIRAEVQRRITAAHERYKDVTRAFETSEMAAGGNVRKLVLGLIR